MSIGLLVAVAAGCSFRESPFVWTEPRVTTSKSSELLERNGLLQVCYADGDVAEAQKLAEEACAEYGLQSQWLYTNRMQCKLTASNRGYARCYDPNMRFANGSWVNTFNKTQVRLWREEQMALTGKPLDQIYAGPTRAVPEGLPRYEVDEPAVVNQPTR